MANEWKRMIEQAKTNFEQRKRVVKIEDANEIPNNAIGEKPTSLRIVETLDNGRLVVVPEYPSDFL